MVNIIKKNYLIDKLSVLLTLVAFISEIYSYMNFKNKLDYQKKKYISVVSFNCQPNFIHIFFSIGRRLLSANPRRKGMELLKNLTTTQASKIGQIMVVQKICLKKGLKMYANYVV